MELISVVIPTHYRADRLINAVKSVQQQTWPNLEIIIVSDGIDDATNTVVNKIREKDGRIQFYSYAPSKGGNYARNMGIAYSKGKYIAFLDDDDVWYASKLEAQMKVMQKNNRLGIVGCAIRVINVSLQKNYTTIFKKHGDLSKIILYDNYIGSTSCALVKREALDKCGTFDESLPASQDHDLWIRICQNYEVEFVETVQMDYYVYDGEEKNRQISKNLQKFIQAYDIMRNKYDYLYHALPKEEYRKLLATHENSIAKRAYEVGDRKSAVKYGQKSWKEKKNVRAGYFVLFSWIPRKLLITLRSLL